MGGLRTFTIGGLRFPNSHNPVFASSLISPPFFIDKSSSLFLSVNRIARDFEYENGYRCFYSHICSKSKVVARQISAFPESNDSKEPVACSDPSDDDDNSEHLEQQLLQRDKNEFVNDFLPVRVADLIEEAIPKGNSAITTACFIGLLTGISVVLFNTAVHEIRDICWDGIQYRGASWLREEPIEVVWKRVVLVPACGGLVVGSLNMLRDALEAPAKGISTFSIKGALKPILKTVAACVTLGTGNSLGPEGPSVEIGESIASGVNTLFHRGDQRKLPLKAAGSAAGISSGFNAAVAGCFFAVESVLWPSATKSSFSLANTTPTVILSAVVASVVSEVGLGSEPAFTVPEYDFRSPSELPLYLLLGIFCGLVSLTLSRCTSFMLVAIDNVRKTTGIPKVIFPALGGLAVGFIALAYPEILYWGFENVDILLESRPFVNGLSSDLLLQLVAVKILATSLCRASGLVGGYYAPSLFIGAASGMAYGKIVGCLVSQSNPTFDLSFLEVASPQAYGLVGMAATLAGACQVPLTAVLLLFELTQDYRIVLPLLGAVGLSSWITSGYRRDNLDSQKLRRGFTNTVHKVEASSSSPSTIHSISSLTTEVLYPGSFDELDNSDDDTMKLAKQILVSQAMRTRYVTVLMSNLLIEVVNLMLSEKLDCAIVVDDDNLLIGLLTLEDIQEFCEVLKTESKMCEELTVYELWSSRGEKCRLSWTVTPSMDLLSALTIMSGQGVSQLPVVSEHDQYDRSLPVGILDTECISLAFRALATRNFLC